MSESGHALRSSHAYDASPDDDDDDDRDGIAPGRRTRSSELHAPEHPEVSQLGRGGLRLPAELAGSLSRALDADLRDVRIHVGASNADALGANAYTIGQDIYFGDGMYQPSTAAGRELIAHEVAHTVQNTRGGVTSASSVSSSGDAHEVEAAHFGRAFASGGSASVRMAAPAAIHRDDKDKDKEKQVRDALASIGYANVSDADIKQLVARYPQGMALRNAEMIASTSTSTSATATRVVMPEITGKSSSVVTYVLPVGAGTAAGRSILLAPQGSAPIMLDAGGIAGGAAGSLAVLMKAGLTGAPSQIRFSHTDSDHMDDTNRVAAVSSMKPPALVLTKQQIASAGGRRALEWSKIQLQSYDVIEIDVTGDGVHVHKEIHGTLELTELRLVSAQQGPLVDAKAKNASSPVTIIKDLATGATQFYLADASPKTVMEIANHIHPTAMAELLGDKLQLAELPHHGGKTQSREVVDYVNMLRMLYKASDGNTTFFVQTSTEVMASKYAFVKVLSAAGIPVATLANDLTTAIHDHPIPVFKDGKLVMLGKGDDGQLKEVEAEVNAHQNTLMRARRAEVELAENRAKLEGQIAEARAYGAADLATAIAESLAQLEKDDQARAAAVEAFWDALTTSAQAAPATSAKAAPDAKFDAGPCQEALAKLEKTPTMDPQALGRARRTVEQYETITSTVGRFVKLSDAQAEAAGKGEVERTIGLRGDVTAAKGQATAALSPKDILESVAAAYRARATVIEHVDAQSTQLSAAIEQISLRVVPKGAPIRRSPAELQHMIDQAHGWGMRPGMRGTRAGRVAQGFAVFQLAVELAEIIQNLVSAIQQIRAQNQLHDIKTIIRDRNAVQWWLDHGANPMLALLDGDKALGLKNDQVWRVLQGQDITPTDDGDKIDGVLLPKSPRVVVTDVTEDEQLRAVASLANNAKSLDAFHRDMSDRRFDLNELGSTPFVKSGDEWATTLWDKGYVPKVFPKVSAYMKQLLDQLLKEKQDELDKGPPTGWETNTVYVYTTRESSPGSPNGMPQPITLPFPGQFAYREIKDEYEVLVASDARTFDELRRYWWPTYRNDAMAGDGSPDDSQHYGPNVKGQCFAKKSDLRAVLAKPKQSSSQGPGDFPDPNPNTRNG